MQLTSSSFEADRTIPEKHGKRAENLSPQLSWEGAPDATRSFALSFVDLDPVARGYVHWLVADMDRATTSLEEGAAGRSMPFGARELTPYVGPFPPSGTHAYEFIVYAVDTDRLGVLDRPSLETFAAQVEARSLATATLVGRFTKRT